MRLSGNLQLPWRIHDVYLFDIDGTLLNCADAVHYFAFCEALRHLSGRPLNLEGVTAHGNTDGGILRDALRLAGVPDEAWRPRLGEARDMMCRFVAEHRAEMQIEVLPSVKELLTALQDSGALLGVATGNLEAIGRQKLEVAGVLEYVRFGAYTDNYEERVDVFRSAAGMARSLAGMQARICVVGDTPADIRAAHANGLEVVAVATGVYYRAELADERPEYCLQSFNEIMRSQG